MEFLRHDLNSNSQEWQPVLETLIGIGFDIGAASRLVRRYPSLIARRMGRHHAGETGRRSVAGVETSEQPMKGREESGCGMHLKQQRS